MTLSCRCPQCEGTDIGMQVAQAETDLRRILNDVAALSDFIDVPGSTDLAHLIQRAYAAGDANAVAWVAQNRERLIEAWRTA